MTKTRIIDNSDRPGQPEPGEDPAAQSPSMREEAIENTPENRRAIDEAKEDARDRQTGQ